MESSESLAGKLKAKNAKKPFLCTLMTSVIVTYCLFLAILFLAGLFYSGKIIGILSQYYDPGIGLQAWFYRFGIIGAMLYLAASVGVILFMRNLKYGFHIFFLSLVAIMILDFFTFHFDWLRYLVHSGTFFIMVVIYFSGKCIINKS